MNDECLIFEKLNKKKKVCREMDRFIGLSASQWLLVSIYSILKYMNVLKYLMSFIRGMIQLANLNYKWIYLPYIYNFYV